MESVGSHQSFDLTPGHMTQLWMFTTSLFPCELSVDLADPVETPTDRRRSMDPDDVLQDCFVVDRPGVLMA